MKKILLQKRNVFILLISFVIESVVINVIAEYFNIRTNNPIFALIYFIICGTTILLFFWNIASLINNKTVSKIIRIMVPYIGICGLIYNIISLFIQI